MFLMVDFPKSFDIPPLSFDTLEEWQMMTGKGYPAFLSRIGTQFVQDAGSCVEKIQEAIKNRDVHEVPKVAHGLKGIAGNVGAHRLKDLALDLEQNASSFSMERISDSASKLRLELNRVQNAFNEELSKNLTKSP